MVKINKLNHNPHTIIYAKLEGNNLGGSIKDRIALKMIEQTESEGELVKVIFPDRGINILPRVYLVKGL